MATFLGPVQERNPDATCYIGNLEQQVDEELLWELFTQVGPVQNVYMPRDRITGSHSGYGFAEMKSEIDADYAMNVLNGIKLYGKAVKVNKASNDKKAFDVGAVLFIGNLEPEVDEKVLYHTFSVFGNFVAPCKIQRDPVTGKSKGYGFVSYDRFESSDAAIAAMNGQYLAGSQISVRYARKPNSKEFHGSKAERLLAANNPNLQQRDSLYMQQQMQHVPPMGMPTSVTPPPPVSMTAIPPAGIPTASYMGITPGFVPPPPPPAPPGV